MHDVYLYALSHDVEFRKKFFISVSTVFEFVLLARIIYLVVTCLNCLLVIGNLHNWIT